MLGLAAVAAVAAVGAVVVSALALDAARQARAEAEAAREVLQANVDILWTVARRTRRLEGSLSDVDGGAPAATCPAQAADTDVQLAAIERRLDSLDRNITAARLGY